MAKKRSLEGARQRHQPDAFDRLVLLAVAVHSAPTLRQTDIEPVTGLVARAMKALVDEGFKQRRLVAIAGLPIVREPPLD